jgi:hypothetical protein
VSRAENLEEGLGTTRPLLPDLERYEASLWEDRESLTAIYESALAARCSPWAVFAACAALALTTIPPTVRLPKQGSLNWFAGLVAPSGFGKGEAVKCARMLIPQATTEIRGTPSSGEGIRDLFLPDAMGTRRQAVLLNEAEIDTLDSAGKRTGSTTLSTLRKAWEGALIDFVTRGTSKPEDTVPEHGYRLCFLCGIQPGRGQALVGDAAGTAQRFMWFPAVDRRAVGETKRKYENVRHRITLPHPAKAWAYYDNPKNHIIVPENIEVEIDNAHDLKSHLFWNGVEVDALDTHEMLLRLKTAVALMALDGRDRMNDEDWWLANVVMGVSKVTRQWVIDSIEYEQEKRAAERGREYGLQQHAAAETRTVSADEALARTASWLLNKFRGAGVNGMNWREMSRAATTPSRKANLDSALTALHAGGSVICEGDPAQRGVRYRLATGE